MTALDTEAMPTTGQVRQHAIRSVKWAVLSQTVGRFAQPLTLLILARLLTPQEFGIAAVGSMAITFSQILLDGGLGRALIQTNQVTRVETNVVCWTSVGVGTFLYAILFALAPWISRLYGDAQVAPVLRVMGLQLIVLSAITTQSALLQRGFDFRLLFWSRLAMSVTPLLVAVPAAVCGYGVWALVWGSLAGSLAQVAIVWWLYPWRPAWVYSIVTLAAMWRFGAWVILEGVLGWFYLWADSAVLGAYLGVHDLGVYRTGSTLVMLVFSLPFASLLPILYSAFCRLRQDPPAFARMFAKALRLAAVIVVPLTVGLFLVGEPLGLLLFGSKWQGLGQVIAYAAILQGWAWLIMGMNADAYRAMGRPDVSPKLFAACLVYYVPTYIWAAPHGLFFFLKARLAIAFLSLPIHMWLMSRILRLHPSLYWKQSWAACAAGLGMAAVMALAMRGLKLCFTGPVLHAAQVAIAGAAGALAFAGLLVLLDRPHVSELLGMCRQIVSHHRVGP